MTGEAVKWRPSTERDCDKLASRVAEIVNAAYKRGENGMWQEGQTRTNPKEVEEFLRRGELLLLFATEDDSDDDSDDDNDGELLGCVRCLAPMNEDEDPNLAELGMLAVAESATGLGLGSRLVKAAEDYAKANGCSVMQLELLSPSEEKHDFKARLDSWYSRIGYVPGPTEPFENEFPQLSELLAVPCKFQIYKKNLVQEIEE
mmetsp:Transcript_12439/g.20148  ORF Transcript_12439/g.20148 Transcript_12439/m.20148 type:complete len:203 (+) Transcript_12439:138-746(+)